ncbi:MAG: cell wall hydrolase [Erythrobacter sp.]
MTQTDKTFTFTPYNGEDRAAKKRGNRRAVRNGGRHTGRHSGRHTGKRLLVLAAAIAVPAMAAPSDWSEIGPGPAQLARAADPSIAPMPFETSGQSFPGSAFYYLEEEAKAASYVLPSIDPFEAPDEEVIATLGTKIDAGPAASSFRSYGSGMNKARALRCMTQAIYYEAASESEAGQRAVAQVVLNRVAHSAWPRSICGVVYEGSTRATGCQFSFTCDGSMRRKPGSASWAKAQRVAARSLSGEVYKPVGLATHYHTNWVNPYWAPSLNHIGTIGAHRFYKMRGRNGTQAAFKGPYAGIERIPTPNYGRRPSAPTGFSDSFTDRYTPSAASNFDAGNAVGRRVNNYSPSSATAPVSDAPRVGPKVPAVTAPADPYANSGILPGAGQVKEEYAGSGRWLSQPGAPQAAPQAATAPDTGEEAEK